MKTDYQQLLSDYMSGVPDEFSARVHLFGLLKANGLRCPSCKSTNVHRIDDRRMRCTACKKVRSFTAGTVFERMRIVRVCLGLLLVWERGYAINAFQLAKLFHVAPASTQDLVEKMTCALEKFTKGLGSSLEAHLFRNLIGKRSRLSQPGEPPQADIDALYAEETSEEEEKSEESLPLEGPAELVLQCLQGGSMSLDDILVEVNLSVSDLSLVLFELETQGRIRALAGSRFEIVRTNAKRRSHRRVTKRTEMIVSIAIKQVQAIHHRCSARLLQRYLDLRILCMERYKPIAEAFMGNLLKLDPISPEERKFYRSPRVVRLIA